MLSLIGSNLFQLTFHGCILPLFSFPSGAILKTLISFVLCRFWLVAISLKNLSASLVGFFHCCIQDKKDIQVVPFFLFVIYTYFFKQHVTIFVNQDSVIIYSIATCMLLCFVGPKGEPNILCLSGNLSKWNFLSASPWGSIEFFVAYFRSHHFVA